MLSRTNMNKQGNINTKNNTTETHINNIKHKQEQETYVYNGCTPITEEISGGRSRPHKASNIIPFIKCTPYYLSAKCSRRTNHQYACWPHRCAWSHIHRLHTPNTTNTASHHLLLGRKFPFKKIKNRLSNRYKQMDNIEENERVPVEQESEEDRRGRGLKLQDQESWALSKEALRWRWWWRLPGVRSWVGSRKAIAFTETVNGRKEERRKDEKTQKNVGWSTATSFSLVDYGSRHLDNWHLLLCQTFEPNDIVCLK